MVLKNPPRLPTSMRAARAVAIALLALLVSGCYYMQAARGQLRVMSARQPIGR